MTTSKLRLGFAGTPELAAIVLSTLLDRFAHQIDIVYTQPDRPAGRGQKIVFSPVKQIALKNNLPLTQPEKTNEMDIDQILSRLDILIVVAYGMILPEEILNLPKYGCINIHTSLLPKWRGAAPIQRAIQAGDTETGVSVIQMDKGLDTGPILGQRKCLITENETSASLHNKLANSGAACLLEVLDKIESGNIQPVPQNSAQATYAKKINKAEARIDWSLSAVEIERTIRAFNPAPVAHTEFNGVSFRLWESRVIEQPAPATPGTIVNYTEQGIDIATGNNILRLLKIQPAGKRVMTIKEFHNGKPGFFTSHNPA